MNSEKMQRKLDVAFEKILLSDMEKLDRRIAIAILPRSDVSCGAVKNSFFTLEGLLSWIDLDDFHSLTESENWKKRFANHISNPNRYPKFLTHTAGSFETKFWVMARKSLFEYDK